MTEETLTEDVNPDRPVLLDTEAELDALVADEPLVLVEFYTDGCGICQSMEPVLSGVAATSEAVVATVNPRDDPPLIERFTVRKVPLLVLFVDGEPVARYDEGFIGTDELSEWVAEHRAAA
jgi:thioredoxin-like negative regulator of GroEL